MDNQKNEIVICLGSSCYTRGNRKNLETIKRFLKENGLKGKCAFTGKLCSENCGNGPVLEINGEKFTKVKPEELKGILQFKMKI
ncbi:MAG: (2Fe-2S) ferredoxin domain-containing protein [Ignavibacteria bacterium]|nr:(2Fe-2S) ferredoxin domain-containing protein [Ignavibacteria bacterium]